MRLLRFHTLSLKLLREESPELTFEWPEFGMHQSLLLSEKAV